MKKLNILLTAGTALLIGATSCKKIDDLRPYDEIAVNDAFTSVKDATSWDVGFYSELRSLEHGEYTMAIDLQSDEFNATIDYGNNYGSVHRWGTYFTSSDYYLADLWNGPYNAITDINVALAGFKTITPTSTSETTELNRCTGDALLARAYFYNRLVMRYAKAYNPTTASSDLGVPLLITYDVNAQPSRATVKAVYDQMIADITQAEGLLASVTGAQGSNTFTIDAAYALEARVRLEMQDYSGAYTAAEKVIATGKYPLLTTVSDLQNYWYNDGTTESITQLYVSTTQTPNAMDMYLHYTTGTSAYDPYYIPTQTIVNLFSTNDIRKKTYFLKALTNISAITDSVYLVNKYPGNPALNTGSVSNYENAPKIFRVGEMYCIAAEAAANNSDAADALVALNALRTARGETLLSSISGTDLISAVQDERTREMAFDGLRMDDLKRWKLGFSGRPPQVTDIIQSGASYEQLVIAATDDKFVWGIPNNDITINPNLKNEQNPGW